MQFNQLMGGDVLNGTTDLVEWQQSQARRDCNSGVESAAKRMRRFKSDQSQQLTNTATAHPKMTTTITTTIPSGHGLTKSSVIGSEPWLRGLDLNQRPSGYENSRICTPIARKSAIAAGCGGEMATSEGAYGWDNYSNNYSGGLYG